MTKEEKEILFKKLYDAKEKSYTGCYGDMNFENYARYCVLIEILIDLKINEEFAEWYKNYIDLKNK